MTTTRKQINEGWAAIPWQIKAFILIVYSVLWHTIFMIGLQSQTP